VDAGPSRSYNEGTMTRYSFATGDLIHCLFQSVKLELKPILSLEDIPTGIAVHGTNRHSWNIIGNVPLLCIILFSNRCVFSSAAREGLSKMKRNHIHIAQEIAGKNVVSGM
jgi:2'-phosphotransferase